MKKLFMLIFLIGVSWFLSGCSLSPGNKTLGLDQSQANYRLSLLGDKLAHYNVRLISQANSIKLLLANQELFIKNSANFTINAYPVLDLISSLPRSYQSSSIAVIGYFSSKKNNGVAQALATERAHRIIQYLWQAKIDSNFMYVSSKNCHFMQKYKSCSDYTLIEFADLFEN